MSTNIDKHVHIKIICIEYNCILFYFTENILQSYSEMKIQLIETYETGRKNAKSMEKLEKKKKTVGQRMWMRFQRLRCF